MKSLIIALAILAAGPVQADVFIYKRKAHSKSLLARIDTATNTFKWRGKTYNIAEQPDCAKYGWKVTGNGRSFDACTATHGYLDFDDEDGRTAICDLQ